MDRSLTELIDRYEKGAEKPRMAITGLLPEDLLAKVDIASMANSLEARSPFLDHRLVEFCAGLPSSMKLRGRTSKWLLRRLMHDRLPPPILTRSKMGFGVPVGEWLRTDLRPLLEDTLLSSRANQRGYFRRAGLKIDFNYASSPTLLELVGAGRVSLAIAESVTFA